MQRTFHPSTPALRWVFNRGLAKNCALKYVQGVLGHYLTTLHPSIWAWITKTYTMEQGAPAASTSPREEVALSPCCTTLLP